MKAIAKTAATQQNATGMHSPGNGGSVVYRINARRLVPRASERRSKMIAFGYYGGKFSHLDFLLPLLPTDFTHYCDPPYPHTTRGDSKAYGHEMSDREHEELAQVLRNVRGAVAVSSYRCSLMD